MQSQGPNGRFSEKPGDDRVMLHPRVYAVEGSWMREVARATRARRSTAPGAQSPGVEVARSPCTAASRTDQGVRFDVMRSRKDQDIEQRDLTERRQGRLVRSSGIGAKPTAQRLPCRSKAHGQPSPHACTCSDRGQCRRDNRWNGTGRGSPSANAVPTCAGGRSGLADRDVRLEGRADEGGLST
jgi:hypothetical protein